MPAQDGVYIGVSSVFNNVEGGFDDTRYFESDTEIDDIPDLMDGSGFGIFGGVRKGRVALEIGYQNAKHDKYSQLLDSGTAKWHVINADLKAYVLTEYKSQPFIQAGLAFPWLNIKDSQIYSEGLRDLTLEESVGLNMGGGMAYYLTPQWNVSGAILYRWSRFGRSGGEKINTKLDSSGYTYNFSFAYTF